MIPNTCTTSKQYTSLTLSTFPFQVVTFYPSYTQSYTTVSLALFTPRLLETGPNTIEEFALCHHASPTVKQMTESRLIGDPV